MSLYGDPTQFPKYTKRLHKLAGDDSRVEFAGTFVPDRIGDILFQLDVLVVPSIWYENTPLVIHSAQQANVPVIASNVSGTCEIIKDGFNGILFERGASKQLATIIKKLCEDRSLLRRLSNASKPTISMREYADKLEEIYEEII